MASETLTQRRQRLLAMPKYMEELSNLLKRAVRKDELMRVDDTLDIQRRSKKLTETATCRYTMAFQDLSTRSFCEFVRRLAEDSSSSVLVWTPRTSVCGTLEVPSILDLDFDFDFDLNSEGILVLLSSDLRNRLLLDWSQEDGAMVVTVEIQGERWPQVPSPFG